MMHTGGRRQIKDHPPEHKGYNQNQDLGCCLDPAPLHVSDVILRPVLMNTDGLPVPLPVERNRTEESRSSHSDTVTQPSDPVLIQSGTALTWFTSEQNTEQ